MARQYRALAEDEDKLDAKTTASADNEIEQLAEHMTGNPISKHSYFSGASGSRCYPKMRGANAT